jgi:predicted ABC-type sugar transport system permease subunit
MSNANGDPSGGAGRVRVILALASDGAELLRQELRLLRQEAAEKVTPAARGSGMMLVGGLAAAVGVTYIVDAVIRLLATRMPHWLASLLFAGVLIGAGAGLVLRGRGQIKNISLVPEKTINSLREDKAWILRQIKSRLI